MGTLSVRLTDVEKRGDATGTGKREFLVVEEGSRLPPWLARLVGRYLPPAICREVELCGVGGRKIAFDDIRSASGKRRLIARLQQAYENGMVCGVDGIADDLKQTIMSACRAVLCDGSMLGVTFCLADVMNRADNKWCRILLREADSDWGQAVAICLARRVRFLALSGQNTIRVGRLANRIWQQEGIAVTVGESEADLVITRQSILSAKCMVKIGACYTSQVMAECALMANMEPVKTNRITADMLEDMVALARRFACESVREKACGKKEIRLTNKSSKHII